MTLNQLATNTRRTIQQQIDAGRLSITLLSRRTGLSPPTLSNFVHGRRGASIDGLSRIVSAIGYTLDAYKMQPARDPARDLEAGTRINKKP